MSARRLRRDREQGAVREERRATRLARRAAAGTGLAVGAALLVAPAAQADTFTVTKLADSDDGVCDADCSLREALDEANATSDADTITFASGLSGTIELTVGELPVDGRDDDHRTGRRRARGLGRGQLPDLRHQRGQPPAATSTR